LYFGHGTYEDTANKETALLSTFGAKLKHF